MAMASNYTVEVRDVNFVRQGQIAPEYLDLMYTEVFRSVGKWTLKLPEGHPLLPTLRAKGSGIIITEAGSSRTYSGRMQSCVLSQDAADPIGTWVITGVDDNVIAAASLVYPDPVHSANVQTTDYWTTTGIGETVMKAVVTSNIGASAITARKYTWLTTAADLARGTSIIASARFDNMGDFLTALGTRANLGWRFYQVGAGITFDVFAPSDKTSLIRLDIRNNALESTELGYSAPSATQVLVLGQGEGVDRTVKSVTTSVSLAEAAAWGLRWEVAKDERNTDDDTELGQAGEEILTEQGATVNSLKITPSDAPNQRLGVDWVLGDLITVIVNGTPTSATVTEVAISVNSSGVFKIATVGDPVGFDWEAQVSSAISSQDTRISALETAVGTGLTHDVEFDTLHLDSTVDASLTSTGNALQIGPTSGTNIVMDNNELMARNNGAATGLFLNNDGGNIGLGDASSIITLLGRLNATHLPYAIAMGSATVGSAASGANAAANVTFPAGRFTVAPFVFAISSNGRVTMATSAITTSGCTLTGSNWSPATMPSATYYWIAVQMTSTTAAG